MTFKRSLGLILFNTIAITVPVFSQDINFSQYANPDYSFKSDTFFLDKVKIIRDRAKSTMKKPTPFICPSKVRVFHKDTLTKSVDKNGMLTNNGCIGMFFSHKQEIPNWFYFHQYFMDDEKLVLIDTFGKAFELKGDLFVYHKDQSFILSYQNGLTRLFDLKTKSIIAEAKGGDDFFEWFQDGNTIFTNYIEQISEEKEELKTLTLNLSDKKFLKQKGHLPHNRVQKYIPEIGRRHTQDCFCE